MSQLTAQYGTDCNIQAPRPNVPFSMYRGQLGTATIAMSKCRVECIMEGVGPEDQYIIVLIVRGESDICGDGNRFRMSAGDFAMCNPLTKFRAESTGQIDYISIEIPKSELRRSLAEKLGCELPEDLVFDTVPNHNAGKLAPILRFISLSCTELVSNHYSPSAQSIGVHYHTMLNSLLLDLWPHNFSNWQAGGAEKILPAPLVKAVEYIRQYHGDDLNPEMIATRCGISIRALHGAFKSYLDCTPMAHVKRIRLDAAHDELKQAAVRGRTVTQVASERGFNHLSKFSRDYSERFGELPSHTWRRYATNAGRRQDEI